MLDTDALAPGCTCGLCGPGCAQALSRPCCGACNLDLTEPDRELITALELQLDLELARLSGALAVF